MRKILSFLAIIFLIASASAAVYITYNPESKFWWSIDKPGPDVSPIVTLIQLPNSTYWTNAMSVDPDSDGVIEHKLRFDNNNPAHVDGDVVITVTCDEGLFIEPDGTVRDFDSISYLAPDMVTYEANNVSCITVVSDNIVRFLPVPMYEFPAESTKYGELIVDMVGMAYGNYTCEIVVIEV